MALAILTVLIFLVSFGLVISGAYFFIIVPMARKKLRTRLEAVQQTKSQLAELDAEILRRETLSDIPGLNQLLARIPVIPKLELFLQQAAVKMQVFMFLLIMMWIGLAAVVIGVVANLPMPFLIMVTIGAAASPVVVVAVMRSRRLAKFEELFPDAMDLLARAVRAGHAFTTAFSLIGDEMPDPLGEEFRIAYRQQNLGLPLRDALGNLAIRVPLSDVRVFVSALQVQRDSGGNLGEILDNLSYVMRERFKVLRQVRTLTAEGRLSMYTLIAMPFVTATLIYLANPEYMKPLFTDPWGQKGLMGAGISILFGYLVIRKIIRIKV
jgi:tight adherence protein B